MNRIAALALFVFALLAGVPAHADPLMAKVYPEWSPFMKAETADPTGLITEARKLMAANPARVADVLKNAASSADPLQKRIALGLLADALYQRGGNAMFEAARGYRALLLDNPPADFLPWLLFMDANVKKILGFTGEARAAFGDAMKYGEKQWSPALLFNLSALEVEVGNYNAAIGNLEDWLGRYKGQAGTAMVLYMLAESYAARNGTGQSIAAWEEAKALEPNGWLARPEIAYKVAEQLQSVGRQEEAAHELEKVGEKAPGSQEAGKSRLATGEMWVQKGNIELAARAYAQLADEKPPPDQLEEAYLRLALLGVLYADEIELKDPFPAYKEFYRPRERFDDVLAKSKSAERRQLAEYGIGELERKEGNEEKAIESLIRAFKNYPETPMSGRAFERFMEVLETSMAADVERPDFQSAANLFETYRETARWSPQRDLGVIHFHAGRAYIGMGQTTKGKKLLEDALFMGTRAVDHTFIKEELLRARMGERDENAFVEWLGLHPDDGEARLTLARLKVGKGEAATARAEYGELLAKEKDPAKKVELMRESDRLSPVDPQAALKAIEGRKKLLAKNPEAGNREDLQEARLKFATGKHAEAAAALEKIPDLTPDDVYILGVSYRSLGRDEKAREIFAKLAKERPDPLLGDLAKFHLDAMELSRREQGGR